ncbi:MAG: ornithine cyclodeaminase family protein [Candidatus Rokubacteria bacterium]|nr:ornithine cyclodeaminase family protein [Candidatus Rokubacteria bacterium]
MDEHTATELITGLRDRRQTVVLTDAEVRRLLTFPDCIEQQALAFREFSAGRVLAPLRTRIELSPERASTAMLGSVPALGGLGCKVLARCLTNGERGLPTLLGTLVLLDPETGLPLAFLSATYLTNARTAAAVALAVRVLSRPDATTAGVYGSGPLARLVLEALTHVRRLRTAVVYSPTPEHRRRYAAEMSGHLGLAVTAADDPAAPADADLVVAATSSPTPVLAARHLRPGTTIASVAARHRELPVGALRGNRLVVDSREAALHEAGELVAGIASGELDATAIAAELGEILLGRAPARQRDDEICVFKSTGLAVQDVVTARGVLAAALASGTGTRVTIHDSAA